MQRDTLGKMSDWARLAELEGIGREIARVTSAETADRLRQLAREWITIGETNPLRVSAAVKLPSAKT
jgi:hypothetical protein